MGSYSLPLEFKASFFQSLYKDEVNSRGEHERGIRVIGSWSHGTPLVILVLKSPFACKSHKWGLGTLETSNSDAKVAVLSAQNHRWRLGPIDNCHSGSKHAVFPSQINRRRLGPIETCNSDPKVAVLHAKTTDESWDPTRLAILVLKSLFFDWKKSYVRSGTHRDYLFWS